MECALSRCNSFVTPLKHFFQNVSHTALTSGPVPLHTEINRQHEKDFEKIVEGILACSGFVTSLTNRTYRRVPLFRSAGLVQQQGDRRRVCIGLE